MISGAGLTQFVDRVVARGDPDSHGTHRTGGFDVIRGVADGVDARGIQFLPHDCAGMLDEFKRLSAQAKEIVQTKDPRNPAVRHFNDDQSECMVLERFKDSEALIEHTANLRELSEVYPLRG